MKLNLVLGESSYYTSDMDTDSSDSSDDDYDSDALPEGRYTNSRQEIAHFDENNTLPSVENQTGTPKTTNNLTVTANVDCEQKNNDDSPTDKRNVNNLVQDTVEVLYEDDIDVTGIDTLNI